MEKGEEKVVELIEKYGNMVYRLALARTGNKDSSEDIFQEVFLKVCKKMPEFQSAEHEKAWLIRVTINCSKSWLNSFWNRKVDSIEENIPFETEEEKEVWDKVAALPEKYRIVLHLYYWEGYRIKEISQILKIKENTIKTRLARAKESLRENWEGGMQNEGRKTN